MRSESAARAHLSAFAASTLATWRPWSFDGACPQGAFLRAAATHAVRVYRAGNRTGKTTVGAVDLVLSWLGWHPFGRFRKGPRVYWASGLDWEFGVGQVLWPAIRAVLPWDQVRSVVWYRQREPSIPHRIVARDGSEITFKSADAGRRKYQGARLDGAWLDEEHPAEVVEEVRARLIDRAGSLTVTATPVLGERWLTDLERSPRTFVVGASMLDAAHAGCLDAAEAEAFAAELPERQRRVRVLGHRVALEGRVYPSYSDQTHVARIVRDQLVLGPPGAESIVAPWPLPAAWLRYAAVDFGTSVPTAVVQAAEDPRTGRLYVEQVLYAAWVAPTEWASVLIAQGLRDVRDGGRLAAAPVADHDAAERLELDRAGVRTRRAAKGAGSVMAGVHLVDRWLTRRLPDGHPALVLVEDPGAVAPVVGRADGVGRRGGGLAWELEHYHYPPAPRGALGVQRDEPVKRDDHAADALRYLLTDLASPRARARTGLVDLGPLPGRRYDPSVTPAVESIL